VLLAGIPFISAFAGTVLAASLAIPAVVDAQEARIRAQRLSIVDGEGTERAVISSGPRANAGIVNVYSALGIPRVSMSTGVTEADQAWVEVYAPQGSLARAGGIPAIAHLGTDIGGEGSHLLLRDRQGQTRILLQVGSDGNTSIETRDAQGNVTWSAP
jgi:hypothetical protein